MNKNTTPDNYDVDAILQETKDKLERPDKFADIFCEAAKSQIKINKTIVKIIKETVSKDVELNNHFNSMFVNIVKKDTKQFFSSLWRKGIWIITVIGSVILTLLTQFLAKKLGL